ncbi:MAG: hypothetical protein SGBAC_010858 [Bacillariaceae sp.]
MIENFRQAAGLGNVFRSGTTDVLGEADISQLEGSDKFVAEKPGLILDLRSKNEVNEQAAQKWMAEQGVQEIESDSYSATEKRRTAVQIDVIFLEFVDKQWLNPTEQQEAAELQDSELTMLRIEKLNERGLLGLNQLILESGRVELCKALMIITRRFEANADDVILIQCVQGKDSFGITFSMRIIVYSLLKRYFTKTRTGMLVMLLQSLSELPDDVIINDYIASDNNSSYFGSGEAAASLRERGYGNVDRKLFSTATKEAIVSTLGYLRQKHATVTSKAAAFGVVFARLIFYFEVMIENFRQAAGIGNVYRSASTDILGDADLSQLEGLDKFVAEKPGLILDLRSKGEIYEQSAQKWMTEQGMQLIESESLDTYNATERRRTVVRINVLYLPRLMAFVDREWLNTSELREAAELQNANSAQKQMMLRIEKLNERGLFGLNQVILESGGAELCTALQVITLRLEVVPDDVILIHCVQGKDRTGMLAMLLQSLMGVSDDTIVEDYFASDNMSNNLGSAAATAALGKRQYGRLDGRLFSRATREAMVATLAYLRQRYGSISPGYLESIGFNNEWRRRLRCRLKISNQFPRCRM